MRVLQINAIYKQYSTGRTTMELHQALMEKGVESYVAAPNLCGLSENCYQIGNRLDWKIHALFSRLFGLQGYFSHAATRSLLHYMDDIKPDIIHLRNLHSNYINIPRLLEYISKRQIPTVLTLHDSWFYTGKCVYYIEDRCDRWLSGCGHCPALRKGNGSLFFDRSHKMLLDKKRLFSKITKLAVIGVSKWTSEDAARSILKNAAIIKPIYNWIDLEIFRPQATDDLRRKLHLENQYVLLGVAMTWIPLKGIDIFYKLSQLLPPGFQLVLVGDSLAPKYKDSGILSYGEVNDISQLSKLYAMADIFVNPTIQETFGKTTAEALACGTPVVAYHSTAMPELIAKDGEFGELVSEYTADAFLKAILCVKTKGKAAYQARCRQRAESLFDKSANISKYVQVYEELTQV